MSQITTGVCFVFKYDIYLSNNRCISNASPTDSVSGLRLIFYFFIENEFSIIFVLITMHYIYKTNAL